MNVIQALAWYQVLGHKNNSVNYTTRMGLGVFKGHLLEFLKDPVSYVQCINTILVGVRFQLILMFVKKHGGTVKDNFRNDVFLKIFKEISLNNSLLKYLKYLLKRGFFKIFTQVYCSNILQKYFKIFNKK